MSEYASFDASFWTGETGRSLRGNVHAQVLAAYLFTNRHKNMIGLYYLPLPYVSHETGMAIDTVSAVMDRLSAPDVRFAFYDRNSEYVWVVSMAKRQVSWSPKAMTGAIRLVQASPKGPLRDALIKRYGASLERLQTPSDEYGLYTLSRTPDTASRVVPAQDQEQNQEQNQEKASHAAPWDASADASSLPLASPKAPTAASQAKAALTASVKSLAESFGHDVPPTASKAHQATGASKVLALMAKGAEPAQAAERVARAAYERMASGKATSFGWALNDCVIDGSVSAANGGGQPRQESEHERTERDDAFDAFCLAFESAHAAAHNAPHGMSPSLVSPVVTWMLAVPADDRLATMQRAVDGFFASEHWRKEGKHPLHAFAKAPGTYAVSAPPSQPRNVWRTSSI